MSLWRGELSYCLEKDTDIDVEWLLYKVFRFGNSKTWWCMVNTKLVTSVGSGYTGSIVGTSGHQPGTVTGPLSALCPVDRYTVVIYTRVFLAAGPLPLLTTP